MRIIVHTLCCALYILYSATIVFANINLSANEPDFQHTYLADMKPSQTFGLRPHSVFTNTSLISTSSLFNIPIFKHSSGLPKLANVRFITSDIRDAIDFGLAGLCARNGYPFVAAECTDGLPGNACPYSPDYVDKCYTPAEWCRRNGYTITAENCAKPKYLAVSCPKDKSLFQKCETDKARACQEDGYALNCESGYILDTTASCPYDSNYKSCVCNPCEGHDYTAEEAYAPGYRPLGPVCNSCGEMKYMRHNADCGDYVECECGGVGTACQSGTKKLFASCKACYEACPNGQLDRNYYWCGSALKCFLPPAN